MSGDIFDISLNERSARLILATRNLNLKGVNDALQQGADVHATDADGTSAISIAVKSRHTVMVQALLQAGATFDTVIRYSETNEDDQAFMADAGKAYWHAWAPHPDVMPWAVQQGDRQAFNEAVNAWTGERGFHPSVQPWAENALVLACEHGREEAVHTLLKAGISIESQGAWIAMDTAVRRSNVECVDALLRFGYLRATPLEGRSLIDIALQYVHVEDTEDCPAVQIIDVLCNRGCEVKAGSVLACGNRFAQRRLQQRMAEQQREVLQAELPPVYQSDRRKRVRL